MFSQKLKELRISHRLTQAQLAKEIGIGVSTIGMYESNIRNPSFSTLLKIANYFGVSIDYLVGDSSKQTSDVTDVIEQLKDLSLEDKKQILDFIKFLKNNYKK